MLRKFTSLLILVASSVLIVSFSKKFYSSQPPPGHTNIPGGNGTCANCHGNLNTGGGSVEVIGLPAFFEAGQTYNFSVKINHPGTAQRWGFAISAVNSNDNVVGSFASSNPNAALNGSAAELAHNNAVVSAGTSYTYSDLTWTAPATINSGDNAVRFFVVGNAANNNFSSSGDFIYTGMKAFTLPVTIKNFDVKIVENDKVKLSWTTASESNSKEFVIERSIDNRIYSQAGKVGASIYSSVNKSYSFVDEKPSHFNRPLYYRLKLVDQDGKFSFSKVQQLVLKGRQLQVFAINAKRHRGEVNAGIMSDKLTQAEAILLNANGIVLKRQQLQLTSGKNFYRLAVQQLSSGVYHLQLKSGDTQQTLSFFVD